VYKIRYPVILNCSNVTTVIMSATVAPGGVRPLTKYKILAMLYLMGRAKQVMIRLVTVSVLN